MGDSNADKPRERGERDGKRDIDDAWSNLSTFLSNLSEWSVWLYIQDATIRGQASDDLKGISVLPTHPFKLTLLLPDEAAYTAALDQLAGGRLPVPHLIIVHPCGDDPSAIAHHLLTIKGDITARIGPKATFFVLGLVDPAIIGLLYARFPVLPSSRILFATEPTFWKALSDPVALGRLPPEIRTRRCSELFSWKPLEPW